MTISEICARAGMSQAELARRMGVTQTALWSLHKNGLPPRLKPGEPRPYGRPPMVNAETLARGLGMNIDDVDAITDDLQEIWRARKLSTVPKVRRVAPANVATSRLMMGIGRAIECSARAASLRRLCAERGLSRRDVVRIVGDVSYSTVAGWFRIGPDADLGIPSQTWHAPRIERELGAGVDQINAEPVWAMRLAFPDAACEPASPLAADTVVTDANGKRTKVRIRAAGDGYTASVGGAKGDRAPLLPSPVDALRSVLASAAAMNGGVWALALDRLNRAAP